MRDKTKVIGLISIIIFIVILIVCFSIITYFNILEENKVPKKKNTTTTTTNVLKTEEITEKVIEEITNEITEKVTTTNKTNDVKTTRTTTTTITTEPIIDDVTLITEESLEDWPYKIFKIINEERNKSGLLNLSVKQDIYDLSLDAVNKWEYLKDSGLKEYLKEYNYYGFQSNILNSQNGYQKIAEETIKNTDITTNKYLKYVGLSLIEKDKRTYFIIIYE